MYIYIYIYRFRQKYLTILQNSCEWNRWCGKFALERSSNETQSISFGMERWSVQHRAFAVETYFKNNNSVLTQMIFRRHFNIHQNECPWLQYLALWGYLKNKVYEKKPRATVDLKQNIGTSGSSFSQHAVTSDAELPETFGGECVDNKGRHLTDTIYRKWML